MTKVIKKNMFFKTFFTELKKKKWPSGLRRKFAKLLCENNSYRRFESYFLCIKTIAVIKLKIHCPEKLSLKNFTRLIKHSKLFSVDDKSLPTKKSVVTFLKSPHVNKTAQRQVEYKTFQKKLTFNTNNPYQTYYFLKKVNENLFFDITFISVKITLFKKTFLNSKLQTQKNIKIKKKLKLLDLKGEKMLSYFFKK